MKRNKIIIILGIFMGIYILMVLGGCQIGGIVCGCDNIGRNNINYNVYIENYYTKSPSLKFTITYDASYGREVITKVIPSNDYANIYAFATVYDHTEDGKIVDKDQIVGEADIVVTTEDGSDIVQNSSNGMLSHKQLIAKFSLKAEGSILFTITDDYDSSDFK